MMDSSGFTCTFIVFIVLSSTYISSTVTQTHIWAFRGNLEIYILIAFVRLRDSNVGCFESVKRYNDTFCLIKGTVHPKMNIIYSALSISKPVWMCLFCRTQRKIFRRMWETEQFWEIVCSPSWELRTASPRGHYGERLQRDSCLKKHMKKRHPLAGDSPWRHYRRDHNIRTAGRIHHQLFRLHWLVCLKKRAFW